MQRFCKILVTLLYETHFFKNSLLAKKDSGYALCNVFEKTNVPLRCSRAEKLRWKSFCPPVEVLIGFLNYGSQLLSSFIEPFILYALFSNHKKKILTTSTKTIKSNYTIAN